MTGTRKMGLRVLCLVLFLLSFVHPVAAVSATESATQTTTAIVRRTAENGGFPIGQMENGTKLNVLGEKGSFYKIDCYDMVGYIAKSQVVHTEEEYYVNCHKGLGQTKTLTYTSRDVALELRNSLLKLAKKQLGSRYRYGGSQPGAFDCSGLTSYLFKKNGIKINRTASTQLENGVVIPTEALQVGDLVFFREAGNSHAATHVGLYIGDNRMIHSARHGVVVESMDSPYYARYYLCARRVINTDPLQLPEIAPVQARGTALSVQSITGRTAQCCE